MNPTERQAAKDACEKAVRCYGIYRTDPDENGGKEYFFSALWHNETRVYPPERVVEGVFIAKEDFEALPDALAEIERLEAENAALIPYRDAIHASHNGYDAEMRKQIPEMKEPASPADALADIEAEHDATEIRMADEIAHLQSEVERLTKLAHEKGVDK